MLLLSCCSVVLSNAVPDDALFRMIPDQSNHGKAVAEVMRDAGIKTVITASRDAEWITDLTDSAEDRFVELGGQTAKHRYATTYWGSLTTLIHRCWQMQ